MGWGGGVKLAIARFSHACKLRLLVPTTPLVSCSPLQPHVIPTFGST